MGTRFNSFYTEEMHPFVNAMVATLLGAQERARRPAFVPGYFYRAANEQFDKNVAFLAETATSLVRERRQNPVDKKDLLNAMLFNKDPKTGEKMTEESIANNMITFLIAGMDVSAGNSVDRVKLIISRPRDNFRIIVICLLRASQEPTNIQKCPARGGRSDRRRARHRAEPVETEIHQRGIARDVASSSTGTRVHRDTQAR